MDEPIVVIAGLEKIIERDLSKHKGLLERSQTELAAYRQSRSQLIARKKHFKGLIGASQYDDDALRTNIQGINVDIRAMDDKVKLSQDAIAHHTQIVDTLAVQLSEQYDNLNLAKDLRRKHGATGN